MNKMDYPLCIYQTCKGTLSHLSAHNLEYFDLPATMLSFGQIYAMKPAIDKFTNEFTTRNYFNIKEHTKIHVAPLELNKVNIKGQSKKESIRILVSKNETEVSNR